MTEIRESDTVRLGVLRTAQERGAETSGRGGYFSYRAAEVLCESLASAILCQIPSSEVAGWRFAAIPRGGLIVLGMLSYLLDLAPSQIISLPIGPQAEQTRLVIVDDCALTGTRCRSALAAAPGADVVFAVLVSPMPLSTAILAVEPRVHAVLSAHELPDRTTARLPDPDDRRAFQQRWSERTGGAGYWHGKVDPFAFAWNEPDHPFFNPTTERVEDGWRLFPPHRVLKTRAALGPPVPPGAGGPWCLAPEVVLGDFDAQLWLVKKDAEVTSFSGVGRFMLRALLRWGGGEAAVGALVEAYEVSRDEAATDLDAFARELEGKGLLRRRGPGEKELGERGRGEIGVDEAGESERGKDRPGGDEVSTRAPGES